MELHTSKNDDDDDDDNDNDNDDYHDEDDVVDPRRLSASLKSKGVQKLCAHSSQIAVTGQNFSAQKK